MMIRPVLVIALLFISLAGIPQQKITGLVEDDETGSPVSYASITPEKDEGFMTDSLGRFSLVIRKQARLNDSILISAVGYSSKRIAIKDLLGNNKVKLSQTDGMLEQVKVFASLKGDYNNFTYYREFHIDTLKEVEKIDSAKYRTNERYRWNTINRSKTRYEKSNKENGEIGYVFEMPTKKFQVGRVQVKINHNYDTCWLKLHLRDVGISDLGLPEDEVLKKKAILPVTQKYGLVEFDLNWEPINIPTHQLYVGFELLRCGCSESTAPSFFFMGSEKGVNFFRENEKEVWQRGGEYTIYVRLMTK
jgi:hypothetical protein